MREFCKHAVASGVAPAALLAVLYEAGDDRWLPDEVRGEALTRRGIARARHRLPVAEEPVDRAAEKRYPNESSRSDYTISEPFLMASNRDGQPFAANARTVQC
ncbi:hypothetical protein [Micromonospora chalcea]|uniref:hypothetical protein n=1 Tax=Micromonospora chalcea TaxID=1874 RepID=UPI003D7454FE